MRHSISKIKDSYNPIISVYGSSACNPESQLYKNTVVIGEKLAQLNMVVASGGYTGVMDAISKGMANKNGTIIGITTDEITRVKPSIYLTEEFREITLMTRLDLLQGIADYHLFLEGSTGTLTELSLLWDKQKLGLLPLKPIFLLDNTWNRIFELMFHGSQEKSTWKKEKEVHDLTTIISNVDELVKKLTTNNL